MWLMACACVWTCSNMRLYGEMVVRTMGVRVAGEAGRCGGVAARVTYLCL